MNGVTLKSRFPEIIAELPVKLGEVAKAGAELIEATAKERVEVDTGRLRDAIHVEKEGRGTYAVVAGNRAAWYGMLLENGTSRSAPRPFLVPSLEQDKAEVVGLAKLAARDL